jgi:hypothetical protein
MILNESHRFGFIYIPKCGGSSIRKMLNEYNQWSNIGPSKIRETPTHGVIDHAHIPLLRLRSYVPKVT